MFILFVIILILIYIIVFISVSSLAIILKSLSFIILLVFYSNLNDLIFKVADGLDSYSPNIYSFDNYSFNANGFSV